MALTLQHLIDGTELVGVQNGTLCWDEVFDKTDREAMFRFIFVDTENRRMMMRICDLAFKKKNRKPIRWSV